MLGKQLNLQDDHLHTHPNYLYGKSRSSKAAISLPDENTSGFMNNSSAPFIRTLAIRIANYPDRLGPSGKFVENSTKVTFLEITGYRID